MSKRILLIENDPRFSDEVKAGFERLGAVVELANDGPSGLERAAGSMPDLILLTIELPAMNGFLVCKKIKKSAGLDQIPLVILSSEASDETFEQHKKLKTHAEDYIHKPVSFEELLARVRQLIPLEAEPGALAEEELEIKGEEIIMESESVPPETSVEETAPLETPADSSLSASMLEALDGRTSERPRYSEPVLEVEDSGVVAAPAGEQAVEILEETAEPVAPKAPARPISPPAAYASRERADAELASLREELESVKQRLAAADKALQEARSAKGKEGGISSREFLDLREQLNRKDRELLALRDQVTARDKQLVDLNDNLLNVARELADAKDNNIGLERELEKAKDMAQTAAADKEAAKKRADDMKTRTERIESKAKSLEAELDQLERARAKEIEQLKAEAARRAAEDAQAKQAAIDALRAELTSKAEQEVQSAKTEHQNELGLLREQLENSHAAQIQERDEEHSKQLVAVNRKILEAETKLAEAQEKIEKMEEANSRLEESLGTTANDRDARAARLTEVQNTLVELENAKREYETRIASQEERIASLESSLGRATSKIEADKQLLERVRKAMAIGLGLLEQQKRDQT